MAASQEVSIFSEGLRLVGTLVRPDDDRFRSRPALLVAHEYPESLGLSERMFAGYREFAMRLCEQSGWIVLSFTFRGVGDSEGNFSLNGWLADLRAAVRFLRSQDDVEGVWVLGNAAGGALCLCAAAEDHKIRGLICLSAPSSFMRWKASPAVLLQQSRVLGVVRDEHFPPDPSGWARELVTIKPLEAAKSLNDRSVLLLHGADDAIIPSTDSEELAEAIGDHAMLRILPQGGRRLRADPRAVAIIVGWLDEQASALAEQAPV